MTAKSQKNHTKLRINVLNKKNIILSSLTQINFNSVQIILANTPMDVQGESKK